MLIPDSDRAGSAGPDIGYCGSVLRSFDHGSGSRQSYPRCICVVSARVGDHGLWALLLWQHAAAGETVAQRPRALRRKAHLQNGDQCYGEREIHEENPRHGAGTRS